jgi:membrane protease YdiL (CAAX protease family)
MTSVPPPSEPSASLHTHPELPDGVEPAERPPGAPSPDGKAPSGSLSPVPAWAPLAAMIAAFVVATIAYLVIAAVVEAGGGNVTTGGPPGLVISATLVQDAALIIAAVWFASMWANGLTPASFGLRRVPIGPAAGWTVLAFIAFWILTAIYISAVGQPDQQELTRDLRDEESLAALIGYGVLLAFVAPLAEELFFRGFVFGVLREKIGTVWGVLATGLVFGLVHVAGSPIETVGVLIILGSLLCVLYLQTGSLLPCIALHAINNAISFSATKSLPWTAGVAIVLASAGAAVAVAAAVTQRPALFSRP